MLLVGYKAIQEYIKSTMQLPVAESTLRERARRGDDPLPLKRLFKNVIITASDLDAWLTREATRSDSLAGGSLVQTRQGSLALE